MSQLVVVQHGLLQLLLFEKVPSLVLHICREIIITVASNPTIKLYPAGEELNREVSQYIQRPGDPTWWLTLTSSPV